MTLKYGALRAPVRATPLLATRLRATPKQATLLRATSVLAAAILTSACGKHAATTATARTAIASCPAAAPRFQLPADGAGRAGLVPTGPVTAAFCQYGNGRATGMPGGCC